MYVRDNRWKTEISSSASLTSYETLLVLRIVARDKHAQGYLSLTYNCSFAGQ